MCVRRIITWGRVSLVVALLWPDLLVGTRAVEVILVFSAHRTLKPLAWMLSARLDETERQGLITFIAERGNPGPSLIHPRELLGT